MQEKKKIVDQYNICKNLLKAAFRVKLIFMLLKILFRMQKFLVSLVSQFISLIYTFQEEEGAGEEEEDDGDGFFVPHGYLSDDEGINEGEEVLFIFVRLKIVN